MNRSAIARPPRSSRPLMIAAGVFALLGGFVVTAPAHAGYYDDSYYGSSPCSYRCGYSYSPYRYYRGCSACGCYQHCYSTSRRRLVYERRYIEREYVERRYGWTHHYRRHYGYYPYSGYYRRSFPYGYGGVRGWRSPYGYRYAPSAYHYAAEGPPRPPAPIPYGYDGDNY